MMNWLNFRLCHKQVKTIYCLLYNPVTIGSSEKKKQKVKNGVRNGTFFKRIYGTTHHTDIGAYGEDLKQFL